MTSVGHQQFLWGLWQILSCRWMEEHWMTSQKMKRSDIFLCFCSGSSRQLHTLC